MAILFNLVKSKSDYSLLEICVAALRPAPLSVMPAAHQLPRVHYRSIAAAGASRVSQMVSPHTVSNCVGDMQMK